MHASKLVLHSQHLRKLWYELSAKGEKRLAADVHKEILATYDMWLECVSAELGLNGRKEK